MKDKQVDPNAQQVYSVTAPVLGPIPPAFVDTRAIESRLAEQRIDLVVRLAEPRPERGAVAHVRRAAAQALSEVLRAVSARVQLRQRVQQLQHVRAVCGARLLGVVCSGRVQEGPGRATENLRVGWAMCTP